MARMNKQKQRAKELKGVQRQEEIKAARRIGAEAKLPMSRKWKDKTGYKRQWKPGDE